MELLDGEALEGGRCCEELSGLHSAENDRRGDIREARGY